MKFHCLLPAIVLLAGSVSHAEENRYDLIGRMLRPFINVFAETTTQPTRAFNLTARLEQMTRLPQDLVGTRVELAMQYPDKYRLHIPVFSEKVTLCRHGQEVWVYPGSKVDILLQIAAAQKKLKLNPDFKLTPFTLPIPEKQLVLLPAIFQIKDIGSEPLDEKPCRVIDLSLEPDVAKSLKAKDWAARVWVQDDARPARLSIAKPKWNMVVRFEKVEFAASLPESTWQPTTDEAADVLKLDPMRYQQLLLLLLQ